MEFLEPVYFKGVEVPEFKTLKEYEVCKSAFTVVGPDNVVGCQRIRGLWRIYVKSKADRIKLIANSITLRNQTIHLYKSNPFQTGAEDPEEEVVKLTFINIPLSKGNSGIETFLSDNNLEKTTDIQFGKVRDDSTNTFTEILSGARFVYVKKFDTNLPRKVFISGYFGDLYYKGQTVPQRPMLCTNCFQTDHYKSQCKNEKCCYKCKRPDHDVNQTQCEALLSKENANIMPFQGQNDILSNFYPCSINIHGILAKSSEHAYQYVKAFRRGDLDTAKKIKDAPNALMAKKLANELPYSQKWADEKVGVMKQILQEKAKQVPEFKDELLNSQSLPLVEAVRGELFWSSGFNKQDTRTTKKKFWPGKNTMGILLSELRTKLKQNGDTVTTSQKQKKKGGKTDLNRSNADWYSDDE